MTHIETSETYFDVAIVGLGYVGLTLAVTLAEIGLKVLGVERRSDVVDMTNAGKPHFNEKGLNELLSRVVQNGSLKAHEDFPENAHCGCYVITVGTPLDSDGVARLDFIREASELWPKMGDVA
ncbi:MAG: NAD-binding protein [Hyphomicrobiales bacterium]|nr:NAD-binding protein [Hyphomicrobiales bacterium]